MEGRDPIDDLLGALGRWAAADRAASAAAERSRERNLREVAGAAATWAGVLVDLAERRAGVTVGLRGGTGGGGGGRRSGRLVGVGRDFVVLEQRSGYPALICLDAIAAVWPEDGAGSGIGGTPAGGRLAAIDLPLVAALAALAADRAPVALVVAGVDEVAGDLMAVGEDVLTVRLVPGARSGLGGTGRPDRRAVLVPVGAVVLCELR